MVQITDGTGGGYKAEVSAENKLETHATTISETHVQSQLGLAYSIYGDFIIPGAATYTILNLWNTSTTRDIFIDQVIITAADLGAITVGDYVSLGGGVRRSAGGTDISANIFNLNRKSGLTAEATAYDNNPTVGTGTYAEAVRIIMSLADNPPIGLAPNGAHILGYLDDITIQYTSSAAGGTVGANVLFYYHE